MMRGTIRTNPVRTGSSSRISGISMHNPTHSYSSQQSISPAAPTAPAAPRGTLQPTPERNNNGIVRSRMSSSPAVANAHDVDIDTDAVVWGSDSKASSRLRGALQDSSTDGYHRGGRASQSSTSQLEPRLIRGEGLGDELVGFTNIGNTCFMNSVLQCLLRTQRLRSYLLAMDLERSVPRPAPLTSTLQDICRRMFSSSGASNSSSQLPSLKNGRSIAPSNFKNCLASYRRAFAGFEQHDAHEFLRFTLDGVNDECNAVTKRPPYVELKDEVEDVKDTAFRWYDNHRTRNQSVVQDAFCGQFASETVCNDCNHRSVSCETFLDLSISVPRDGFAAKNGASESDFSVARALPFHSSTSPSSVQHALAEFFAPVDLSGTDAYKCPKCKKATAAKRTTSIIRAPEVLVLHLKRFRHSRFHATKINDLVTFPVDEDLSLQNFMHPQAPRSSDDRPTYILTGVAHHMGSVHSGHYIAHCRCAPKPGSPTSWYEFNDSSVTAASAANIVVPSAYILFFEKSSGNSSKL